MNKKVITFGGTDTEKFKFHHRKNFVLLEDVETQKTQVSNIVSSIEKKSYIFFICYKDDDHKIKHFFIGNDELLETYYDI